MAVSNDNSLWETALSALAGRIQPHNFDMWLRPLSCRSIEYPTSADGGGRIVLVAPNRWLKEWFEDNYQDVVLEALRAHTATDYEIVFEVEESEGAEVATAAPEPQAAASVAAPTAPARPQPGDLLAKYTFDSFVVGPSNQLAHAASRACAEVPAGKYNPLFIHGGVGLGKSHLVQAIGHRIREEHPSWRILYLKAETYMNEYINSLRNGKMDEFRKKYREKCDVFLVDDIQLIAGKDRTQHEFFHIFNTLFETHKQIVLTADQYPHQIPDLEDRLRSRFQQGLIADIQTPDLETRIAILKKKAELDQMELPDDVAAYLATHIKSNVRELEGLLIRVAAFASLQNQQITVEFTKETLKNFLSQASHALTVETVQKEVAAYFNVKVADLKSPKRHQAIARPRQIAMFLARKLCQVSYPELGQKFGGKDHTTVLSAFRKIEKLCETDPKTRHTVEELERHLVH